MSGDKTILEDQRELQGWIVVLSGDWKGRDYRLFTGKTIVGSNPYAGVYLPEEGIEPFHFSIRFDDNREAWLTDLDSHSGLFIDDRRVYRQKIEDEILFKVSGMEFLIKLF
ncbi:MAG: FHA domain-containing protein [bacterium]|nr:FHA domain-containing protein [bacterium]